MFKTFEEYMIDPSDLFRPHGTQDPIQEDVWVAAERILLDRDRDRLVQPDYD